MTDKKTLSPGEPKADPLPFATPPTRPRVFLRNSIILTLSIGDEAEQPHPSPSCCGGSIGRVKSLRNPPLVLVLLLLL